MFWHQLALRMGSTIRNLKQSMSYKEFISWIAFNNLSPISDDRADYHAAQITGMIYAANTGAAAKKFSIEDFKQFKKPTKKDLAINSLEDIEREFYESFKH